MYLCVCVDIYIYIYREGERERERVCVCLFYHYTYMYVCIYIYMVPPRAMGHFGHVHQKSPKRVDNQGGVAYGTIYIYMFIA